MIWAIAKRQQWRSIDVNLNRVTVNIAKFSLLLTWIQQGFYDQLYWRGSVNTFFLGKLSQNKPSGTIYVTSIVVLLRNYEMRSCEDNS